MSTVRIASILVLLASAATAACGGKSFSVIDGADGGAGLDGSTIDGSTVDGSTVDASTCPATLIVCPTSLCGGSPLPVCGSDRQWHCPAVPVCIDASVPDGDTVIVVPVNHRADDSACKAPPPPGDCSFQNTQSPACKSDDECTAGTNGRCGYGSGGIPQCVCSYDECADDAACAHGSVCACHGSMFNAGGNACVQGNCAIDADCGGNYCSPAVNPSTCGSLLGYFCHTKSDECIDDKDCHSNGAPSACTYVAATKRWECAQVGACAGAPTQPSPP